MFSIPDASLVNTLWLVLIFSWIIINVFWSMTMQRALEMTGGSAKMVPVNVWLGFIPVFGLYWQFAVVQAVADSLSQEYIRRGIIAREGRPGFSVGLTANILLCCAFLPSFGILVALVSNISRLIHLFKIKNYTSELEEIIRVQMQHAQEPQIAFPFEVNPSIEEELKKNNPNRFMPPETEEEARKRWGRKNN